MSVRPHNFMPTKKVRVSKCEIVSDIRRVARLLSHSPSSVEYRRLGRFDVRTVQRKFKVSWNQIISSAGLQYSLRTSGRIASTEELKRDLLRVARELGHPPTRAEYHSHGRFDPETMRRRSQKKNWEDALGWLTGFDREDIKYAQARGGRYCTTQEWLSRLHRLALDLGHAPTTRESNAGGINAHELCKRVGGKWIDVLKAANIDTQTRNKRALLLTTTTETLIEDVVAVAKRLGRTPTVSEYVAHGHYSYLALKGRLGGWRQVKKLVVHKLSLAECEMIHPRGSHVSESAVFGQEAIRTFFRDTAQQGIS